jgi:hypothetical protein
MNTGGELPDAERAKESATCDGAGFCECDLCVPHEFRGFGAQKSYRQLLGALWVIGLIIGLVLLMGRLAHAQTSGNDFCQSPNPTKSSAVISCSGTGEGLLVGAAANQQIQVCSIVFDLAGTTPTAQLDYGTDASSACDTGATHLSGLMTASKAMSGPLDCMSAAAGNQLCLKLGGTSPTAVG